jgi:hypothetical protein
MQKFFRACLVVLVTLVSVSEASAQGMLTFRLLDQFGEPVGAADQAYGAFCIKDTRSICQPLGYVDVDVRGVGSAAFAQSGRYVVEFGAIGHEVTRREFTLELNTFVNLESVVVERERHTVRWEDQNQDIASRPIPKIGGYFEGYVIIGSLATAQGESSTVTILASLQHAGVSQSWVVYEDYKYVSTLPAWQTEHRRWIRVYVPKEIPNGFPFCVLVRVIDSRGRQAQTPEQWICGVKGIE